jgi:hypothetical protein
MGPSSEESLFERHRRAAASRTAAELPEGGQQVLLAVDRLSDKSRVPVA